MLSRVEILEQIYAALRRENELRDSSDQIPLSPDARLFGSQGMLKSFDLVSLILDLEVQYPRAPGGR